MRAFFSLRNLKCGTKGPEDFQGGLVFVCVCVGFFFPPSILVSWMPVVSIPFSSTLSYGWCCCLPGTPREVRQRALADTELIPEEKDDPKGK